MPRKSAAALATPTFCRSYTPPAPPNDLPQEAAKTWRGTLAALPEGWIGGEALPLLERFARHTARVGELERLIAAEEAGSATWRALVQLAGAETRHVCATARALRLTPQSRMKAETAHSAAGSHRGMMLIDQLVAESGGLLAGRPRKPWESMEWGDDDPDGLIAR